MHLFLLYFNSKPVEAILLAASHDRMRVIIRENPDTIELLRIDGHWLSSEDEPVELASLLADGACETERFCSQLAPRAFAAG
jgi:hypothetical protein